ncbi:MAG: ATP-dependent DNA helicase, partial [bacterium]
MAKTVLDVLQHDRTAIVEAGTGIGKSLAYLVPLALWLTEADPPRAIVSTYTKALQKQLFEKELPFIKKHFFPSLRYAVSFGSDNYLCLRRLEQARQHGLFDAEEMGRVLEILRWSRDTATGLKGEFPIGAGLWQKICRESDTCFGRKCCFYHGCFYQTAKALERKANIIITNHHLFFAHVASNYSVLPDARGLVLDEAHEIEDIASDHLGIRVSNYQLRSLLDSIISSRGRGLLVRLKWLDTDRMQEISAAVERVRRAGELFFTDLERLLAGKRSLRLHDRMTGGDGLADELGALQPVFESLARISGDEEERIELQAVSLRMSAYREGLINIQGQDYGNHV